MAKFVPQEELSLVDQVRIRREKLAQLRESGNDPFRLTRFDVTTNSAAIKAQFADEPRVFLLPDRLNAMQYKGYVKRLSGLVAARTHVSIAAYSTFVPTLVIGYSVKARGIARDLFGEEAGHLLPAQELSGEAELIAAYDALMKRGNAEREQLQRRIPSYMAGQEETLDAVLDLAKGK